MSENSYRVKRRNRIIVIVFLLLIGTLIFCNFFFPQHPLLFHVIFPIALGLFIFSYVFFRSPFFKGKMGEHRVTRRLKRLARRYDGYLINDVVIPGENDKTSQVDHVLLTIYGIFVVETKNYSGMIFGSEDEQHWTQVLAYGRKKNKFYNPILQNRTHIYRLNSLFENRVPLKSVVVFVNGDIDNVDCKDVYELSDIKHFIIKDDPVIIARSEIEFCNEKLARFKENPIASGREHVDNIRKTQRAIEHNICPRCGGRIVLKTSQKTGKGFWACENYPKCKFIKKY